MKPNILNPAWRYVRSEATDISKTFARIRREQQKPVVPVVAQNVRPIVRVKK